MTPFDEYDAAASNVAGQSAAPMDQAAARVVQGQKSALRSSLYDALLENPDMAARAQQLGKRTGLPADVVGRNMPEVERRARLDEFDQVLEGSPAVAKWLTEQNNARVAHDDAGNLSMLERAGRQISGGAVEAGGMALSGFGVGLNLLQRNILGALTDMLPTPRGGEMTPEARQSAIGPLLGQDFRMVGGGVKRFARNDIMVPAQQQTFMDQVGAGLGQVGGQILMAPFFGPAGLYLQGLDVMDEKVGGDNASQGAKDLATVAGAVVTGVTEKWALDKLLGPVADNVKASLAGALARIGVAAASEGAQEATESIAQDLLRQQLTNPDAEIQLAGAAQEGGVGATVGGIVRGIVEAALHVRTRHVRQEQQAQQSEAHAKVLGELATLAEASKVRGRDPEAFATFMQSLTEEGVPNVYVDAKALLQAVDINEVASVLPSVAEQIEQAAATGGDVVIPTAELLTAGPGQTFMQTLVDNARTAPDAMSPVEAREYMQAKGDQLAADIQTALGQQEQDQSWRQMRDDLRDEFKAQLDGVKRFTSDVNLQYANLLANFYAVTAAKLGQTPQELATRYGLRVQSRGVEGGQVLDQVLPDFADMRAKVERQRADLEKLATNHPLRRVKESTLAKLESDLQAAQIRHADVLKKLEGSKLVDAKGNPMVVYHGGKTGIAESGKMKRSGGGRALWFSDANVASTYAGTAEGATLYPVFPVAKNPMEFDAKGATWQELQFEGERVSTDDLSDIAEQRGHDALVIRSLRDADTDDGGQDVADHVALFNPEQVISATSGETLAQSAGRPLSSDANASFQGLEPPTRATNVDPRSMNAQPRDYSAPLPDTIEIDGEQRPTTNSNGQPIAQTEEGVRNFWKWFGDSHATEAAVSSKQKRHELRPLVVYHGTRANFDSFAPVREGNVTTMFGDEEKVTRRGIFFAESPEFAATFAKQAGEGSPTTVPVYLSIQNPLYLDEGFTDEIIAELREAGLPEEQAQRLRHRKAEMAWAEFDDEAGESFVAAAKAAGYDGALTVEPGVGVVNEEQQTVWVAFAPEQIKSAIGNNGEFDPADPSILNQFAGPNAQTADTHALATAQARITQGDDAETVRRETGWHQGVDGKWRFEISDHEATTIGEEGVRELIARRGVDVLAELTVGDVLHHPALYAAYPAIAKIGFFVAARQSEGAAAGVSLPDGANAAYNPARNEIRVSPDVGFGDRLKTVLLHEIQHGIQEIEGFAAGGSPKGNPAQYSDEVNAELRGLLDSDQVLADAFDKWAGFQTAMDIGSAFDASAAEQAEAALQALPNGPKAMDLWGTLDGLADPASADRVMQDRYQRLAGEVEARNTQSRANLDERDRQHTRVDATADTPTGQVIVVFGGKEMASAPAPANAMAQEARGSINLPDDLTRSPAIISLFAGANLSTFIHESGHFFLEVQMDLAARILAKQQEATAQTTVDVVKRKGTDSIDVEATLAKLPPVAEGFARLFRGESPTTKFADVFDASALTGERAQHIRGKRYTTDIKYADYYRSSYGSDATLHYVDVPQDVAQAGKVNDYEFKVDTEAIKAAALSEGERSIVNDANILLTWFGIKGSETTSQLTEWFALDLEGKRPHHEKFARGFEAYGFEGNAPSLELQSMFRTFRAWMLSVYKELKALRVELTDDVRGVMDRMLASTQAIQEAEAARRLGPLFKTAEDAGMSLDDFRAYHALATDASQAAIEELQARGLRDMKWLEGAKDRKLKELQKLHDSLRREVRAEVRREVMSQPVYRAWQFLTGKGEADETAQAPDKPKASKELDVINDDLLTAVAKLGGLAKEQAVTVWGIDPKEKPDSGVFGTPVLRANGGLSIDAMAERLLEAGYLLPDENGKHDTRDFEDRFNAALRGESIYSLWHDYKRPDDDAPVQALPEGIAFGKLDTAELERRYGNKPDAPWRKLQKLRMTSGARGLHIDVVAEVASRGAEQPFTSGDQMVKALLDAEPPQSVIEGMTSQRMLERFGDLGTPEGLQRAVDRAIHNEVRARFLSTEIAALERGMQARRDTGEVNAKGQRVTVDIMAQVAKQQAERIVGGTKVKNLRPSQYTAAETRAAKAAERAMLAGNTEEALAEKRHQLINLQAARAATRAQEEVEKIASYLRRFNDKPKGLDADYYDQIAQLLERFDLARSTTLKQIAKRKTLAAWVESQREQGLEPDIPPELLDEANRTSYKDMTVDELRGLRDTVRQIEKLGRVKNTLLTAKQQRDFQAVRDLIGDSILANAGDRVADTLEPATVLGRKLKSLREFGVAHIKAATWARVFDGGKDGGPMWEYFIRPANEAADMETRMRAEATEKLHAILAPVIKAGRMDGKGQHFPTIGRAMNREQVFAMALNMGNEGNIQRMLDGEGWTIQQIEPVLATLSAADWQAVQAVWDHFESYRPLIGAKERRVYGKEPAWVAPMPLSVRTADGQTVQLRGGYYPVKYNPERSHRAEQHENAEDAKRQMQAAYTSATTRRGFTKSRAEAVKGRPLLYSLAGVYSNTQDVIHDLAWHEWLIDANKLLRSDKIADAIRETYGPDVYRQFTDGRNGRAGWVEAVARGEQGLQEELDSWLGRVRQGVSISGLGFNVMSAAIQPIGLTQSVVRVGGKWIGRGVAQYLANPLGKAREVNARSEFMASRARTRLRELNELRNQVEGEHPVRTWVSNGAFYLMTRMQMAVDVPTWLGAYEKAISEGNSDERAGQLADQAVIDSQGGGQTKDLSAIERGGPAQKLFTVFYSFMNTALNVGVAQTMTEKSKAKLVADYLLLYSVPAVLTAVLKDALVPGDSGDWEDLDKILRKLLEAQLDNLFGLMVGVREVAGAAKMALGLSEYGRDYQGPAGLRLLSDITGLGKEIGEGELDDGFRKRAINVMGSAFGLPAAQANRTITGAQALIEGETENPAALAFGYQKP